MAILEMSSDAKNKLWRALTVFILIDWTIGYAKPEMFKDPVYTALIIAACLTFLVALLFEKPEAGK
jgi:hypothetical protein